MSENFATTPETTDEWPWSKIVKHILLPKPKGSPKAGKKEMIARGGFAAAFGLIALVMFSGNGLPSCNSSDSTGTLEEIVNDMPVVKMSGAKFVSIKDISELGFNKDSEIRSCSATLITTEGADNLQYSIKWDDAKHDNYYIQAQII